MDDDKLSELQRQSAKPNEPGWLIIETHPQCERKAADELRRAGLRAYMPQVSWIVMHQRTKEKIVRRRPLMRGYILALPRDQYHDLTDLWGVKRVMKHPGTEQPFRLKRQIVAAIMRAERNLEREAEDARVYRMGRRRGLPQTINRAVTQAIIGLSSHGEIISGPFVGRTFPIVGVTDDGKVLATVSVMGKEAVKEFEPLVELVPLPVDVQSEQPYEAA